MRTEPVGLWAECAAPIAVLLMVGVIAFGFVGGYWLMQPRVLVNPGLAAYEPPPATRLMPLARKMDAPELAELPRAPVESAGVQAPPVSIPAKVPAAAPPKIAQKHSRPRSQRAEYPRPADAYAYAYGHWGGAWSSSRGDWNARW